MLWSPETRVLGQQEGSKGARWPWLRAASSEREEGVGFSHTEHFAPQRENVQAAFSSCGGIPPYTISALVQRGTVQRERAHKGLIPAHFRGRD
jgi:hypothetical protein